MIVGNGDIASVLPDRPDLLFFASGVSNSQEKREEEYGREYKLLMEQSKDAHIVYFSTLSIFYKEGRYQTFKRLMEGVVRDNFKHWTIIRLGNLTWGTNPHTLINYMRGQEGKFVVQPVERYIVDEAEFLHWIGLIPEFNCEMNVPGQRMSVREVVQKYVV